MLRCASSDARTQATLLLRHAHATAETVAQTRDALLRVLRGARTHGLARAALRATTHLAASSQLDVAAQTSLLTSVIKSAPSESLRVTAVHECLRLLRRCHSRVVIEQVLSVTADLLETPSGSPESLAAAARLAVRLIAISPIALARIAAATQGAVTALAADAPHTALASLGALCAAVGEARGDPGWLSDAEAAFAGAASPPRQEDEPSELFAALARVCTACADVRRLPSPALASLVARACDATRPLRQRVLAARFAARAAALRPHLDMQLAER